MNGEIDGEENEYQHNMVRMLALIRGQDYMAPAGAGKVARIWRGIDAAGKRVLDIGCGIGGPAFDMARMHGAIVTGIDLEAPLIQRARQRAERPGLAGTTRFQ